MKGYQFVNWFPRWGGLWFVRLDPKKTSLAHIYDWRLMLLFWEVRKWSTGKKIYHQELQP